MKGTAYFFYDTSGCSSQGFSWLPSNRYLNRSKLASTRLCSNQPHYYYYCLSGGVQVQIRQQVLVQLLGASKAENATNYVDWLDAEGSSLIRTLGKTFEEEDQLWVSRLFEGLVMRHFDPIGDSEARSAASQTCSLAVAYILPIISKYTLPPSPFPSIDTHASSFHFIPAGAMPDCEAEGCICQYLVRFMESFFGYCNSFVYHHTCR